MKNKTIIIAEAGVNHNGNLDMALELIDAAASAGVDYVKFQTFKTEKTISKRASKASYQKINSELASESQFDMVKKLELSYENHQKLISHCQKRNIKFLSTAFDLDSVAFLKDKIDFYKIPSGEITNLPYLEKVAGLGLPIVMSTGMATLQEVKDAMNVLVNNGAHKDEITILHCNTEYPTPMEDVNLLAMKHIEQELGVKVGYSDHTLGIEVPIAAVALGACVIEKHFTLDRTLPGPDHPASLEPSELKAMVSAIRNIELALSGSGIKTPSASEEKNRSIARKSLHLARAMKAGELVTANDLEILRPGDGISPMDWHKVIGKTLKEDKQSGDLLWHKDLQ